MKPKPLKHVVIGLGIAAVIAVVVGVLAFMNISTPRKRTVTLDTVKTKRLSVDEAAARRELDRRLADYRSRGEPILVADFKPPPINPTDNAAEPLMAAIKALDRPELGNDPVWQIEIVPNKLTDAQWQQIDAAMTRYAPALALIDQADGRQAADWKIEFKSPALQILFRNLNGARQSANLLRMSALSSHRAGRHDETVHRLTQMTLLARHVDNGHPALVGHLVASGISRLTTETIKDVAPALIIAPRPGANSGGGSAIPTTTAPAPAGAASRTRVNALIAALLDPRTLQHGWVRSAQAERMFMYDSYQCLIDGRITMRELAGGPPEKNATTIPTPPAGQLLADLGPLLDYTTALIAASKSDRLPDYRKLQPTAPSLHTEVSRNLVPAYDRAAFTHYAALTELRLAAAAVALRAYAADHNGAFPASLDELVPQYLPAVPADPLVAAPATILYRDGMVSSAGVDARKSPTARSAAAAATAATRATPVRPQFFIRVKE